ncbi:hypothetical protein [Rhizobium sp. FKY42]|uniref:hypothetical protein n=1 Tax=Rhizobium sp. FKY42 TaxID=2562310 RepID=UPI001FEE1A0F|nr:hypothetical protein [Rhizobium sp. FKY42]
MTEENFPGLELAQIVLDAAAVGLIPDTAVKAAHKVVLAAHKKALQDSLNEHQITLWLPEPDVFAHQAIGKLIEEMGEASAIAARILIQGLDQSDPKSGIPNRQALAKELADVAASIGFVQGITMIDRMPERTSEKLTGFAKWVELLNEHQAAPEADANG